MKAPFDIAADLDTPVSAYLKLRELNPRFLLESVEGGERLGRYSFLGFGNGLDIRINSDVLQNENPPQTKSESILGLLRHGLDDAPRLKPDFPELPFQGGLVGVAGFDLVRDFEKLPKQKTEVSEFPLAAYFAPTGLLVFDHLTRRAALFYAGSEQDRQALRRRVIAALRGPLPVVSNPGWFESPQASMSAETFTKAVRQVKKFIHSGDVYQLVLSICFTGKTNLSPFETYRALRLLNPSPYMYFLEFDGFSVVGSSPEALVRLDQEIASLRPIAGTRPRGDGPDQDLRHEQELLADPKEVAEHVMLVDLARNDLGRVAKAGTISVEPYRVVERYSHVMHLVSGVTGRIKADKDAFDVFCCCLPSRYIGWCSKSTGNGTHKRARTDGQGTLRRNCGILWAQSSHGSSYCHSHAGF